MLWLSPYLSRKCTANGSRDRENDELLVPPGPEPWQARVVEVAERAGVPRQHVRQLGPEVDLHALYRVEHHEPELPVEDVEVPHALERRALAQRIVVVAEDAPIPAQAVVAHVLQVLHERVPVRDHAPRDQQVGLLVVR